MKMTVPTPPGFPGTNVFAVPGVQWTEEQSAEVRRWLEEPRNAKGLYALILSRSPWTMPATILKHFLASDLPALRAAYAPPPGGGTAQAFLDSVQHALEEYLPSFPVRIKDIFQKDGVRWDDSDVNTFMDWIDYQESSTQKFPQVEELLAVAAWAFPESVPFTITINGKAVKAERTIAQGDLMGAFMEQRFEDTLRRHIEVCLVSCANDNQIPETGKRRLIIAKKDGALCFRIFDGKGKKLRDKSEKELVEQGGVPAELRKLLDRLWENAELTPDQQREVAELVAPLLGIPLGYLATRCRGDKNGFWGWLKRGFHQFCRDRRKQFFEHQKRFESLDQDRHDPAAGGEDRQKEPVSKPASPYEFLNGIPESVGPLVEAVIAELERKSSRWVRCLKRLEPLDAAAVILQDVLGWSVEAIQKAVFPSSTKGAVKTRLFRARQELKRCLQPHRGDL